MKNRLLTVLVLVSLLVAGLSFPGAAQAGGGFCHVVQPGEYLSQIANRYGVTVSAIVSANNLWNPNFIYAGQCLVIPGVPTPGKQCTVTHVVKRGEYLKSIAARYGVRWQDIVAINNLKNPNLIYPGQQIKVPVACKPAKPKPKPKPTPDPTPKPWKGLYWGNRYLSGDPKVTRYSTEVNFKWGLGGPGDNLPIDDFSARFSRTRYFDAGSYRFHIKVDDGVRFWVDNVALIDQWHDTGAIEYSVDKQLSAGNHQLQIDYYEHTGGAQIRFWIEPLNGPKAWKGEFFNNTGLSGDPAALVYSTALDFDWGNKAPTSGITADYFSVRWTGDFDFVGGTYQFSATVDDGIRLYLDNTLIIDQWHISSVRTYTVDVQVSAGPHSLRVEYFENKGAAVAKVGWTQK